MATKPDKLANGAPSPGALLIADPFLKDPNFARSVVLLCEHRDEGSMGFVINRLFNQSLDELIPGVTTKNIPVHVGGPVQLDTVHFVHRFPDLISESIRIAPGVCWGGSFETAIRLLNDGLVNPSGVKFFIGYSGWGGGQLAEELAEKSWLMGKASSGLVFRENDGNIWRQSLETLGGEFAMMANYPIDPTLN